MIATGVVVTVLALVGCGGDGSGTTDGAAARGSQFVGELEQIDAFIGLVVRTDGSVIAYVCDGDALGMWATGRVDGEAAELNATTGAGGIEVAFEEGRSASGTVMLPDGREVEFEATAASGEAGLYRRLTATADGASGESELTGWVVLGDGRTKGSGGASGSEPTPVDKVSRLTIVQQCPRTLPEDLFPEELTKMFGPPRYTRASICGIPAGRRGSPPPPVTDVNLANADVADVIDELEAALGKQIADCLARQHAPERPLLAAKGYGDLRAIFNQLKADSRFQVASSNLYNRINEAKDADAISKAEAGFRALIPPQTVRLIDEVSAEVKEAARGVDLAECLGPEPPPAPDSFTIPRDTMSWDGSGEVQGDATYTAEAGEAGDGSFLLHAGVDVGSSASAEADVILTAPFDVPKGVSGVTVTVRGGGTASGVPTSMIGNACHSLWIHVGVYDAEEHELKRSTGSFRFAECSGVPLPVVPVQVAVPVPNPPMLLPSHYTLEFEPDDPRAHYVAIYVTAKADTDLFASIFADFYWFLDDIEVSLERG